MALGNLWPLKVCRLENNLLTGIIWSEVKSLLLLELLLVFSFYFSILFYSKMLYR